MCWGLCACLLGGQITDTTIPAGVVVVRDERGVRAAPAADVHVVSPRGETARVARARVVVALCVSRAGQWVLLVAPNHHCSVEESSFPVEESSFSVEESSFLYINLTEGPSLNHPQVRIDAWLNALSVLRVKIRQKSNQ